MSENKRFELGCNYLYGENGFDADPEKALELFEESAKYENEPSGF